MRPTALVFVSAIVLSSSLALAEAPGEIDAGPAPTGPSMVEPTAGAAPSPCTMGQRWSVGLSLGQLTVAPKGAPDAKTDYAVGELALRYRATHHLELELALGGGKEQLADGSQGARELSTGTLGLRYRFSPGDAWNWWLMAGIGKTSIASASASQEVRDANAKPHGQFGVGVERRFERFALQAELRWIAIGKEQDHGGDMAKPSISAGFDTTKLEGGQVTAGLSYYF